MYTRGLRARVPTPPQNALSLLETKDGNSELARKYIRDSLDGARHIPRLLDEPCLEVLQSEIKRGDSDDVLTIRLLQNALTAIKRHGGSPQKASSPRASGIGLSRLEEDLKLANMRNLEQHNHHRKGDSTLRADAAVGGVAGKVALTPRSLAPASAGPALQRHASPSRAVAANPFRGIASGPVSERGEDDRSGSASHRRALRQSMSALPLSLSSQRGDTAITPRQKGLPWGDKLSLLELQLQAADYGDTLRQ